MNTSTRVVAKILHDDPLLKVYDLTGAGKWWYELPRPWRWHHCSAAMLAVQFTHTGDGHYVQTGAVERCPCGSVRLDGCGGWMHKNQRKS